MDEIEILIVLTLNAIIAGVACITFGLACNKQKNIRPFFFVYIFIAVGCFLSIFQFIDLIIYLISVIFFALTAAFFFISAYITYYKSFIRQHNQNISFRDKLSIILIINLIIMGFQIFIIIIVLISIFMLFRIYLKNHSPTILFLLITGISAIISEIALYVQNYGVEGAFFFGTIITTFFVTLLFSTGFVALLEQKVIATSNEKNELKDRYSHDLGNILHTITMSYDLFKMQPSSEIKTDDLDKLIKSKINEASKLVKFIRSI